MARIEQIERDKLGARQQALYDEIMRTRPRGKLSGPFSVWIYQPDIAEPANAMANCFRVSPKLDKRSDRTNRAVGLPRRHRPIRLVRPFQSRARGRSQ
jgi:hypothetical protein